jgi:oligoribonuclease NrnB/cAMP/cGMP phosphodiesterase (DHH superfamily)
MKCFLHLDLDGRCAGSIVAQYTENYNPKDYFEVDYIKPLPLDKISENETVFFVDYSFKMDTVWQLDEILKKTKNVIWIDHHESSIKMLEQRPALHGISGIRQEGISGAALTYMYLYNCDFESLPLYIRLVSDYDCWQYKLDPDTTYFKIGIDTVEHGATNSIWLGLSTNLYLGSKLHELMQKGEIIKQYIDQEHKDYRDKFAYESEIDGYKCLVVNRKCNSWIFGDKYNYYPLVMVWAFNGNKYDYSIFSSNKDVNCREIAEKRGGGGHPGAAGFNSDEMLFKKV